MTINPRTVFGLLASVSVLTMSALISAPAAAAGDNSARRAEVINFWTAERRAAAIPRDLVVDSRGLGYLRRPDGSLLPHGHQISALRADPTPRARPGGVGGGGGGTSDSTPPTISGMNPGDGQTIGLTHTFSATVEDASGVKSASFFITDMTTGLTESFPASNSGGDSWSVGLTGFTDGPWSWRVEARDNAKRGGNLAVSDEVTFTVATGGSGGGSGGNIITNSQWTGGGDVQTAVGRLYFQMPSNSRLKGPWNGYVCSGTVVNDGVSGRSVILTASHCVYDDANKAFARNVLFIPNQANTTGGGTDTNCGNDPLGCWVASFGVVDVNWTTRVFPDNIPWDYGFYVIADSGAHQGNTAVLGSVSEILDQAVPALTVQFTTPSTDTGSASYTHALGYSYSDDPNFMYCAEEMTTEGADNWWLPSCGLSGGSSGGSWIQPLSNGSGPIISVNSWGYTTSPGMAGPKLSGTSAQCVMGGAVTNAFDESQGDGQAGYAETCP